MRGTGEQVGRIRETLVGRRDIETETCRVRKKEKWLLEIEM